MHLKNLIRAAFAVLVFIAVAGCAEPKVEIAYRPGIFVEKPEVIVIRPFAPSLAEAKIDSDVLPAWIVDGRAEPQLAEDVRAGEAASQALARELVAAFKARGLPAVAASAAPAKTPHMVVITGQFVSEMSGTPTLRPAIGYRAGKGMETRLQITQHGNLIGELKAQDQTTEIKEGAAALAGKIADQVASAYVMRGWLPAPVAK